MAAIAAFSACSSESGPPAAGPEVVRGIAVLDAHPGMVPDLLAASGTVRAAESAQLAAQVMGTVVAVNVREGDTVKRGQVLAVIDDTTLRAAAERAEAALNGAKHEAAAAESDYLLASATMKRYQDLFDKKAVSPQEFDEVKARLQGTAARREMAQAGQAQARAALTQAGTMLDFARIRAPFDGTLTERRVDPGALASPGVPLLTVETGGRFRLEVNVDESNLHLVKAGDSATVQIDAMGNRKIQGRIVQIAPAADPASRSVLVKVELPANLSAHSGLFGRAYFQRGRRQSLMVPQTAVVQRGQLRGVYVVGNDQIAALRYVSLGQTDGENVEVLSGLQAGEHLVAVPENRDLGGKKIQ